MIATPKVSIVVAAYNVERFLARCIDSLLAQTESSLEVLLVNDGSSDGTSTLADSYAVSDARVRVVHRQNGGLSVARNTGLSAARGEYVCFIDADDWVEPDMVKSMVTYLENSSSDVVIAGFTADFLEDQEKLIKSEQRLPVYAVIEPDSSIATQIYDEFFINLLGYAWNKLYRREWLITLDIQFEPGLSLVEDIVFNGQVLSAASKLVVVPETFVHYVQRPRPSLGNTFGDSYLLQCFRAIESVDLLLKTWGVPQVFRTERAANKAGLVLWSALRSAVESPHPKDQLRCMLQYPGALNLLETSLQVPQRKLRQWWATITIKHQLFWIALLPVSAVLYVSQLKNSFVIRRRK